MTTLNLGTDQPTTDQLLMRDAIQNIDLWPVRFKLVHEYSWSEEKVYAVEKQYKLFLWIMVALDRSVPPNKEIDDFWHNHILDTELYAYHCQTVFGKFVHHFPYFGIRGGNDAENLMNTFQHTLSLIKQYGELFGAAPLTSIPVGCEAAVASIPSDCVGECAEVGCSRVTQNAAIATPSDCVGECAEVGCSRVTQHVAIATPSDCVGECAEVGCSRVTNGEAISLTLYGARPTI